MRLITVFLNAVLWKKLSVFNPIKCSALDFESKINFPFLFFYFFFVCKFENK